MSTRWIEYETSFDTLARLVAMPVNEAMVKMREHVEEGVAAGRLLGNEAISTSGEIAWHEMGRPAYRVTAQLAEALLKTRLDFDSAYVRFPHRAFSIEVPINVAPVKNGKRLVGLLVSAVRENLRTETLSLHCEAPDGATEWKLNVTQRWEGEDTPVNFMLTMIPGEVIADRVASAFKVNPMVWVEHLADVPEQYKRDPQVSHDDTTRQIISLAIGSAMFAVSSNSQYKQRLQPKQAKKKGRRNRRSHPPQPTRWILGADVRLPGRESSASGSDDGEGRSLHFSHIRQGHLALRRCGARDDWHYELRYIAPTIVRPDLPQPPQATRHRMHHP